jgi:Tol biopolymer transport system component
MLLAPACRQRAAAPEAQMLIGGSGDQRSPCWLPDGSGLIFSASFEGFPDDLFLFDPATKKERRLTDDPSGDSNPAVSPDGRFVAFHSDRSGAGDIYRLRLATSETVRLTSNSMRDGFCSWSPDGTRIAFHSEGAGDADLWIMDADGKNKVPLVVKSGVDSTPAWSPKGDAIAFTSEGEPGNPDLFLVYLEDKRVVQLTHSPEAEWAPAWSPDGRRIAYCRGPAREGHANLWIMNADGTDPRPLTVRRTYDDYSPAWSPDGARIAFESNRSGDFDIWVLDVTKPPAP